MPRKTVSRTRRLTRYQRKLKTTKSIRNRKPTRIHKGKKQTKFLGGLLAVGSMIGSAVGWVTNTANAVADKALTLLGIVAGPLMTILYDLGKKGATAFKNLMLDIGSEFTKKEIDTHNIQVFITETKRKLLLKNPAFQNHDIMNDLHNLNMLCYYIDNQNAEGIPPEQYDGYRQAIANDVRAILLKFNELMKSA